jgi:hypothetical protein
VIDSIFAKFGGGTTGFLALCENPAVVGPGGAVK